MKLGNSIMEKCRPLSSRLNTEKDEVKNQYCALGWPQRRNLHKCFSCYKYTWSKMMNEGEYWLLEDLLRACSIGSDEACRLSFLIRLCVSCTGFGILSKPYVFFPRTGLGVGKTEWTNGSCKFLIDLRWHIFALIWVEDYGRNNTGSFDSCPSGYYWIRNVLFDWAIRRNRIVDFAWRNRKPHPMIQYSLQMLETET